MTLPLLLLAVLLGAPTAVAMFEGLAAWHATRIQARAIRRCGELLKQIERPEQGGRPKKNGGGAAPVSRAAAASAAGLSRDQRRDALRVASIPKARFEREVEERRGQAREAPG